MLFARAPFTLWAKTDVVPIEPFTSWCSYFLQVHDITHRVTRGEERRGEDMRGDERMVREVYKEWR